MYVRRVVNLHELDLYLLYLYAYRNVKPTWTVYLLTIFVCLHEFYTYMNCIYINYICMFTEILNLHELYLYSLYLNVYGNCIYIYFICMFTGLVNLRELYLQNNLISTINNITFIVLKNLQILNLQGKLNIIFLTINLQFFKGSVRNIWKETCMYTGTVLLLFLIRDTFLLIIISYFTILCCHFNITKWRGHSLSMKISNILVLICL